MPPCRTARVFLDLLKLARAVAPSLQLFNKVDLQAVMKTGRWSSGGTFTSFYVRDLCPRADSLRRTGPVVATGEIIVICSSQARLDSLYIFFKAVSYSGNLVDPSFLPIKRGCGQKVPKGTLDRQVLLSVGVSLCLPPWSQN